MVGKEYDKKLEKLYIGEEAVAWNDNMKYLGLNFSSGPSLLLDHKHFMHKFSAAANAICSHVKFASHMSVLFLLETFCLPLLSCCCEVLVYSKQQISQLNVCLNNAYRKAFTYNLWDSVKELQLFCERMDLKHIFAFRKLSFCWKVSRLDNRLMNACYSLYSRSTEFIDLMCNFNIDVDMCSLVSLQSNVFSHFYSIVNS